ncbi:unnamed protein product, partial [Effrenium voratum]
HLLVKKVAKPSRQRHVLMEEEMVKEMAKAPGRRQRLMKEMAKDHVEMLPLMSGLLTTEALIMEVLNTEALILEVLNTELIMEVMSMEALILEVLNTELSMEVEIMEVRHDGETLIVAMRGIMEEVRSVLIRETLLVATRGVVLIMEAEPEEEWEDTWWAHVKDEEEEPADDSWWGNIKDEQETKEKPHDEAAAGGWSAWQSSWKS